MKAKKLKKLPKFKSEDAERDFWARNDSTEYFDLSKPLVADFSSLRPSTISITLRLPQTLLRALKLLANKKDVPYQSLMKVYLDAKVREELGD